MSLLLVLLVTLILGAGLVITLPPPTKQRMFQRVDRVIHPRFAPAMEAPRELALEEWKEVFREVVIAAEGRVPEGVALMLAPPESTLPTSPSTGSTAEEWMPGGSDTSAERAAMLLSRVAKEAPDKLLAANGSLVLVALKQIEKLHEQTRCVLATHRFDLNRLSRAKSPRVPISEWLKEVCTPLGGHTYTVKLWRRRHDGDELVTVSCMAGSGEYAMGRLDSIGAEFVEAMQKVADDAKRTCKFQITVERSDGQPFTKRLERVEPSIEEDDHPIAADLTPIRETRETDDFMQRLLTQGLELGALVVAQKQAELDARTRAYHCSDEAFAAMLYQEADQAFRERGVATQKPWEEQPDRIKERWLVFAKVVRRLTKA